ncbi:hypothetical protein [Pseudomonas sp. R76]|uniref:hypothetical protein n=1 Tax=Pseudomonas sp. R76 TaxID=1573711 RepID=UPI00135CA187|nr:hypothetical protein [Pseudomonas sp. R76]
MLVIEGSLADCNQKCSFCSEQKATALWMGDIDVFVCSICAVELLPQLMADAIVGAINIQNLQNLMQASHSIQKERLILERFHKAFSSALIRKIRIESGSLDDPDK